ncbi:hypothetical protein L7F22_010035 [Adiantum nelumboides]|nr:hypothetical protein [Adiantum nelumboides]
MPCVPPLPPLIASRMADIACDQLVDRVWFYGALASQDRGGNAHQEIFHVKDTRDSLDVSHSSRGPHGPISEEKQRHQTSKSIDIEQQSGLSSVEWLRRVFDTFDENKDGLLSLEELKGSFQKLGLESLNVHCLLHSIPVSNDQQGAVSHDDFVLLYQGSSCKQDIINLNGNADSIECCQDDSEDDLLWEAFNVFDKDKDGFISPTELQSVLCNLGFEAAKELDACIEMIRGYDRDGNGLVDFEEFKEMLSSAFKLN